MAIYGNTVGTPVAQSDWNQNDPTKVDYIKNKPALSDIYDLPTASQSTLGGIKVGNGLSINNGVLSVTGGGGVADSVDWSNIQNKPTIPSKTSDLTNDNGYLTDAPNDGNQYTRKNGAWALINNSVLSQSITVDIAVGGITSGTVYQAGTSIESILRDLLCNSVTIETLYVGKIDDVSLRAFKELDSQTLISSATAVDIDDTPVVWNPTKEVQAFYMLVKNGSENLITGGSLISGGLTTTYTSSDITNASSTSWKGNAHSNVIINSTTYRVFGLAMSSWNTSDVLTINFNKS